MKKLLLNAKNETQVKFTQTTFIIDAINKGVEKAEIVKRLSQKSEKLKNGQNPE